MKHSHLDPLGQHESATYIIYCMGRFSHTIPSCIFPPFHDRLQPGPILQVAVDCRFQADERLPETLSRGGVPHCCLKFMSNDMDVIQAHVYI
jgi:hypothetical protein